MSFPFNFHVISILIVIGTITVDSSNLTDSQILEFDAPTEIKENFHYYLSGFEDDDTPIWVFELGHWDLRKYTEKGGELYDAMDIHIDQMFLRFKESAFNSTEKQFGGICDMEGFQLRQAGHPKTVQFILEKFVRFEQVARNGTMKQGWFVNSNLLWERIWQLGRPLLGALASSIEVYGSNAEAWIPKLLKQLPKDQLPEWYGGYPNYTPFKVFGWKQTYSGRPGYKE